VSAQPRDRSRFTSRRRTSASIWRGGTSAGITNSAAGDGNVSQGGTRSNGRREDQSGKDEHGRARRRARNWLRETSVTPPRRPPRQSRPAIVSEDGQGGTDGETRHAQPHDQGDPRAPPGAVAATGGSSSPQHQPRGHSLPGTGHGAPGPGAQPLACRRGSTAGAPRLASPDRAGSAARIGRGSSGKPPSPA
jgi:hypothetical protein